VTHETLSPPPSLSSLSLSLPLSLSLSFTLSFCVCVCVCQNWPAEVGTHWLYAVVERRPQGMESFILLQNAMQQNTEGRLCAGQIAYRSSVQGDPGLVATPVVLQRTSFCLAVTCSGHTQFMVLCLQVSSFGPVPTRVPELNQGSDVLY
jgi:hypothetical protein